MGKKNKKKALFGNESPLSSDLEAERALDPVLRLRDNEDKDKAEAASAPSLCPHVGQAVNLAGVKKALKVSWCRIGACGACLKEKRVAAANATSTAATTTSTTPATTTPTSASTSIWLCLRCGQQVCQPDHVSAHVNAARSDTHCLLLDVTPTSSPPASPRLFCHQCKAPVAVDTYKKLREAVDFVLKQQKTKATLPSSMKKSSSRASSLMLLAASSASQSGPAPPTLPKARGLSNLGNTCFFNAVMQSLSQSHPLTHVLDRHGQKGAPLLLQPLDDDDDDGFAAAVPASVPMNEAGALTLALASFFKEMNSLGAKTGVINPGHLYSKVVTKAPQFRGFQQQDAHELLRNLIEGLRGEEIRRQRSAILKQFGLSEKTNPQTVDESLRKRLQALGRHSSYTLVDKIFGGQLVSAIVCETCHNSSQIYEPFLDLSLPLVEEKPQRPTGSKKRHVAVGDDDDDDGPTAMSCFGGRRKAKANNGEKTLSKKEKRRLKKNKKKERDMAGFEEKAEVPDSNVVENDKKEEVMKEEEENGEELKMKKELEENEKERPHTASDDGDEKGSREMQSHASDDEQKVGKDKDDSLKEKANVPDDMKNGVTMNSSIRMGQNNNDKPSHLTPKPADGNDEDEEEEGYSEDDEDWEWDEEGEEWKEEGVSVRTNTTTKDCDSDYLDAPTSEDASAAKPKEKLVSLNPLPPERLERGSSERERSSEPTGAEDDDCDDEDDDRSGSETDASVNGDVEDNLEEQQKRRQSPHPTTKRGHVKFASVLSSSSSGSSAESTKRRIMRNLQDLEPFHPDPDHLDPHMEQLCRKVRKLSVSSASALQADLSNFEEPAPTSQKEYVISDDDEGEEEEEEERKIPDDANVAAEGDGCGDAAETAEVAAAEAVIDVDDDKQRARLQNDWLARSLTSIAPRYHSQAGECSVYSCLTQFTAPELLTGNNKWACDKCTRLQAELEAENAGEITSDYEAGVVKNSSQNGDKGGDDNKKTETTTKKPKTVYSNASKQLLIFCPPAILTVHLKRFQQTMYNLRKVNRHVSFPLELDLAPFCSTTSLSTGNVDAGSSEINYVLYAVVEHSGRLQGGHYTAFVRARPSSQDADYTKFYSSPAPKQGKIHLLISEIERKCRAAAERMAAKERKSEAAAESAEPKEAPASAPATPSKWYYASDTHVSEVSEEKVLKCQAYLLFYERVQ